MDNTMTTQDAENNAEIRMLCETKEQTRTESTNPKREARMPKFVNHVARRHA